MRPHTFEAPEGLVDAFPRKVSWMVKEAVMVLWEEPEEESDSGKELRRTRLRSLGQPSAMDKYPNVTLWIGRGFNEGDQDVHRQENRDEGDSEGEGEGEHEDENKDQNKHKDESERQAAGQDEGKEEMIVLLQMTFHIKVSSGNRKKAFDMFCILESANLVITQRHGNFLPLSMNNLPPTVYDCLKHPEPTKRLLHVRLCAQESSRVLMHRRPHIAKNVTGTPLHLMLLLQSLSRTLSFDAYLSYSTYAAECLKTVATALDSGVSTPAIDLHRVFAGVGGCFDYWEQFNPDHFAPPREAHLLLTQHSPPRYEYSEPTHDIAATRKRPRPCSSSSNSPPRYVQSKHDKLQGTQAEKESHLSLTCIPPPSYVRQQPNLPVPVSLDPAASPSSPKFPPTPLAFPPIATTSTITHSPTVLVPASDFHISPDTTTVDFSDYVPDTPLDMVCTPDAAINTPWAASPPITALPPAASSPSSGHAASIASPPLVPTLTCLFRSCILDMNTLSPKFYKLHRFHVLLLSLASAATSGSKNDFVQAKAKATTSVLVLARNVPDKREKDNETHQTINLNLLHELDLLLQWMYTHDLDATGPEPGHKYGDGPLLTCLRQMAAWGAAFRKTLKSCLVKEMRHGDKAEAETELKSDALIQGFRQWEAECVAQFYLSLIAKAGRAL